MREAVEAVWTLTVATGELKRSLPKVLSYCGRKTTLPHALPVGTQEGGNILDLVGKEFNREAGKGSGGAWAQ